MLEYIDIKFSEKILIIQQKDSKYFVIEIREQKSIRIKKSKKSTTQKLKKDRKKLPV